MAAFTGSQHWVTSIRVRSEGYKGFIHRAHIA